MNQPYMILPTGDGGYYVCRTEDSKAVARCFTKETADLLAKSLNGEVGHD